jgi:hypothetical protein
MEPSKSNLFFLFIIKKTFIFYQFLSSMKSIEPFITVGVVVVVVVVVCVCELLIA